MAKKRKRGNGEGSIYRKTDGRWCAQYSVESPGGAKRKTIYGKTRRELAQKLREALSERDAGVEYDSKITVEEYLGRYLEDAESRLRPKTFRRYQDLCDCHLILAVGERRLLTLAPDHLRAIYRERLEAGYSARTVGHLHALIKQVLAQAVLEGLIPRSAAEHVKPPRGSKKEIQPLTPGQVRTLLTAATETRYEALYVVAITAGLRRGELLGLTWDDVDFERGTLQVRRTLQQGEMLAPKTAKSRRQIRLTRRAVDALMRHWRNQETERALANGTWTERGLVFPNRTGKATDGDNLCSRHFKPLLQRAGLPPIRFHDLRHTCATLLLSKGVHPKIVSEMLGHATISITLDTYSHVIPGLGDAAASAMDDALEEDEGEE